MDTKTIRVDVVYCAPATPISRRVTVVDGAPLEAAIVQSHLLDRFSEIDLKQNRVGVFGTVKKLSTPLRDGDRVEIYRPITCDPETVPRRDLQPEPANDTEERQ